MALPQGPQPPPASPRLTWDLRGYTALYGGSFDPPHMGHQMACLMLLEAMGADAVCLVPTGVHAFGKSLSPSEQRLAMAGLLAAPFGNRCQVSAIEQHLPAPSTTYRTLLALQAERPGVQFAIAVGADLWPELGCWQQAAALWQAAPVALVGRAGQAAPDLPAGLPSGLPVALPNIRSRDVRARCRANRSIATLVPASIAQYIAAHRLYAQQP